jgi:cytochrome c2
MVQSPNDPEEGYMSKWFSRLTVATIMGFALLGGMVVPGLAQDETPPCNLDTVLEHQQEHAAEMVHFSHTLEGQTDAALEVLYRTGIAYQALAVQCGFEHGAEVVSAHEAEHSGETADDHDEEAAERLALAMTVGDPENGELLFNTMQPDVGFACATCHYVDRIEQLVGPGLLGIGDPAHDHTAHSASAEATEEAGHDMEEMDVSESDTADEDADHDMDEMDHAAETPVRTSEEQVEYFRTSILDPSAFVVPGFPDNLMPKTYEDVFTEDEINDLIAYLLTL